jgi:hypothetical protein
LAFFERSVSSTAGVVGHSFPLPIFGVSASRGRGFPKDGYSYASAEYFEIAADYSGSPLYGYSPSFGHEISLIDAVAMSGAAIDTPDGRGTPKLLRAFNFGIGSTFRIVDANNRKVSMFFADAGFIENLGLLPLLRRGCTKIVSLDNSFDPSAGFGDWGMAVQRAAEEGWQASQLKRIADSTDVPKKRDGWSLAGHFWSAEFVRADSRVNVTLAKLGFAPADTSAYPVDVVAYARDSSWRSATAGCTGSGLGQRCSFPLESTVRQSYSASEFRAYRLLGRCLARRLLTTESTCR